MGFQQGLSGLNSASKDLDVIGNNISNSSTVGFKASQAQFSDVFANSLAGSGGTQVGIGTQLAAVAQQFSQGNITSSSNPLDVAINGSGFFRMSDNGAISYTRNGQFQLDKDGYIVNTTGRRLTGYAATATGAIITAAPVEMQISSSDLTPQPSSAVGVGLNLNAKDTSPSAYTQGNIAGNAAAGLTINAGNDQFTVTVDGTLSGTVALANAVYASASALATEVQNKINADATLVAAGKSVTVTAGGGILTITSNTAGATSTIAVTDVDVGAKTNLLGAAPTTTAGSGSVSPSDPTTYNSSTSITLYDTLGYSHVFTMYFAKVASNTWMVNANIDGGALSDVNLGAGAGSPQTLSFSSSGALTTTMPLSGATATVTTGATSPLTFSLDFRGTTQFGSSFGVNTLTQDGYASGHLSGFSIGSDGMVQGRYTNGQTRNLGQVVLANFTNTQGLQPLGNSMWAETSVSGAPLVGSPSSGSLGLLQASAIEESNVDLTAELVKMITAQRAYQASAQSIKTQDAVLQTLVNLR